MRRFWPSHTPRHRTAKEKKAMPVLPKARMITAFAGSYIGSGGYQTSPSLTCPELSRRNPPTAYPSEIMKAVKGKKMAESYST